MRSSKRLLGALVAAGELARQRQEALDQLLAVDRVAPVEVALEERAVLVGPVGAAAGSSAATSRRDIARPRAHAGWSL